jgi:hypothetical protein
VLADHSGKLPLTSDQENPLATVRKDIVTTAHSDDVWDAIRDIGALHTRLVPGFVIDTRLEPGARWVTFANGHCIREPIITLDEQAHRLVWSAEGVGATHYNASAQVVAEPGITRVIWLADFLPDDISGAIELAMDTGAGAMKVALDKLAR